MLLMVLALASRNERVIRVDMVTVFQWLRVTGGRDAHPKAHEGFRLGYQVFKGLMILFKAV